MDQKPSLRRDDKDELTLLVFKDGFAARTFRIPLKWVSKFGLLSGLLALASLFGLFWAFKFHHLSRKVDPRRIQELTDQVNALTNAKSELEAKLAAAPQTVSTSAPTPLPENIVKQMFSPSPLSIVFHALPLSISPLSSDGSPGPVIIDSPQTFWRGKVLHTRFNIKYSGEDRKSQQGRIIILARGPETMLAYPAGAFNTVDHEALINPDRGEFFSVSRFRATSAQFATGRGPGSVREIEVLLVSDQRQLILRQTFPVSRKTQEAKLPPDPLPATTSTIETEVTPEEQIGEGQ